MLDYIFLYAVWLQIFIVENFHNYSHYKKYCLRNSRIFSILLVWCRMHRFGQVFQVTLSVLHSLHHINSI